MIDMNNTNEKLELEYPCAWTYKVIGTDPTLTKDAIEQCCCPASVEITYSHTSSKGKYHSFNATVLVNDEETRLAIFDSLKHHTALKMVL